MLSPIFQNARYEQLIYQSSDYYGHYEQEYLLYIFLQTQKKVVPLTISQSDLLEFGYQSKKQRWTEEEDKKLLRLTKNTEINWDQVSNFFPNRNPKMCYNRHRRLFYRRERSWSMKDDQKILKLVSLYGEDWSAIKVHFARKNEKQLKEHYENYLKPGVVTEKWDLEADLKLVKLIAHYGCNWSEIEEQMPERAYSQIKNRYYGRIAKIIRKKLISQFGRE